LPRFGLSVAILTPFDDSGAVDVPRLVSHADALMSRGVESVTLFGTTGEGASIGHAERRAVMEEAFAAGLRPERMIVGICASAAGNALAQIQQAAELGVRDFLLTPPFFFKPLEDLALFDWHRMVIGAGPGDARYVVYNIPQLTGVPISTDLLGRLCDAFPGRIRAVKDSSGSQSSADGYLRADHTSVLVGDERLLPGAMRDGAAGAISGMANLHPEAMRRIVDYASDEPALMSEVEAVIAGPVIASIKALLARDLHAPSWEAMRPPLSALSEEARDRLYSATDAARAT